MRRKLHIKTSLWSKPALCIFKANQFHLIESVFARWRNIIKWTTIENENDNDTDDDIDIDNDDDRKDQDSAPFQQQYQQRASIIWAINTTHACDANDPPRSSRFRCLSLPELPSDANNAAVSTPQLMMRRRNQHRPPFSHPPPLHHRSTNFLNATDNNFQSITGSTLNNDFINLQTLTAQTNNA